MTKLRIATSIAVVLVVAAAFVVRVVLLDTFETVSPAMEPALRVGDRFLVARETSPLSAGDVVVMRSPLSGMDEVTRVIGLPGDRIEIVGDVVDRNGVSIRTGIFGACLQAELSVEAAGDCESVEEEVGGHTWRTFRSTFSLPESMPAITVPAGRVLVLGDHRDRSTDSRDARIGLVPLASVRRASVIYWSSDRSRIGQRVR